VIVALDNDPAGIKAARHAHELLIEAGVSNPDTITLPTPGQDPAQVLADHRPAALARRRPLADLVVDDITNHRAQTVGAPYSSRRRCGPGAYPDPSTPLYCYAVSCTG